MAILIALINMVNDKKLIEKLPVENSKIFKAKEALKIIYHNNPHLTDNLDIVLTDYDFYPIYVVGAGDYFVYATTKDEIEEYAKANSMFVDKELNAGGEYE